MGGGGGGGGGMGTSLPMGSAFDILTVKVGRKATAAPVLGPLPALSMRYDSTNVPNFATPRPFILDMSMMVWTINGRVYEMEGAAEDEMVNLGDTMAWEWVNNSPIPIRCTFQFIPDLATDISWDKQLWHSTRAWSTAAGRIRCWSGRASG
jgi:FtsP/CotA-like multicopper oxidase with cupredoxin domain